MRRTPAPYPSAGDPGSMASGAVTTALLCVLILSVCLGPRIRLEFLDVGRTVDLRLQDLFLPMAAFVALVAPGGLSFSGIRQTWGRWLPAFAYVAILLTVVHLLLNDDVAAVRRILFLARQLEPFLLAAVICALYRHGGPTARRWSLRALHLAVLANVAWMGYQLLTGTPRTLLGSGVGDLVQSYGPKLVGEPSAFGTGSFFAFVAALSLAEYRTRATSRPFCLALLVVAAGGAYVSGSRISLGSVIMIAVVFAIRREASSASRAAKVALVGLVAAGLAVVLARTPDVRMSEDGVDASLQVRVTQIWAPFWEYLSQHPLVAVLGLGPGGLGSAAVPASEAHNAFLRAWLDFGLMGAVLYLALIASAFRAAYRFVAEHPGIDGLYAEFALLCGVWILAAGLVQDAMTPVSSSHLVMLAVGLFAGHRAVVAGSSGGAVQRAGTPLTTVAAATSRTTQAPAPTVESAPR